jgi:hypothetical protein
MHQESLNFNPFFLLISEVVSSLSLFDLLVELINDNRNEKIHDEECGEENVQNKYDSYLDGMIFLHHFVWLDSINGIEHVIWPHLQSRDFEKG